MSGYRQGERKNGTAKTRDAGLVVTRSNLSQLSEILTLPPEESEARLVEWARKEHDEAEKRAREQIRRILESE